MKYLNLIPILFVATLVACGTSAPVKPALGGAASSEGAVLEGSAAGVASTIEAQGQVLPGNGQQKKPALLPKRKAGNTEPLSDFDLARYQYCGRDSDCLVSINGCCDCMNGGKEVAVNKLRLEAFRKNFDCLYVACGSELADEPCGRGVVSCVNLQCKYLQEEEFKDGN